VNSLIKKHTNNTFDAWSKLISNNQFQTVDKIIQTISKQQEMKEEGEEHKNLFTQFGLMMIT